MPDASKIDYELKKLKVLIEDTNDSVITFALYRDAAEQQISVNQLKERLDIDIKQVALKNETLNPVNVLLALPKSPRLAVFFTFLGSSLPKGKSDFDKFAGYVNIQREAFADVPHALIFWLREEQLVRLMKSAPDFWAWRSGVFDLRKELQQQSESNYPDLEYLDAAERGRLEEKVALYEEILEAQLERDKPDLGYVVRTRLRLARTLNQLAMHDAAIEQTQQATEESERINDAKLRIESLHDLAYSHHKAGHYREAEPLYHQVIEIDKATLGEHHFSYAARLSNLANLLRDTGRYEEAEPLYHQVIGIDKATLGEQHPHYATSLNNLAGLLRDTGRDEEAEPLYHQVIEIHEATLKEQHPSYATGLNNLAELLRDAGRYEEAEPLYRQVIEIYKAILGEQHPHYAISLSNLAILLEDTGRYEETEPLFRQVTEIHKATLGKQHPYYAISLNNLASLLEFTGRYGEAEPLYKRAVSILVKRLGRDHPTTAIVKNNYQMFLERRQEGLKSVSS